MKHTVSRFRDGRGLPGITWSRTLLIVSLFALVILPAGGQITVVPPEVTITDLETYHIGDMITLSGTTNLASGNELLVEVLSQSFGPTQEKTGGDFFGASGTTLVQSAPGEKNTWSFSFDTATFGPDTYLVTVTGVTVPNAVATSSFSLVASTPTQTPDLTTLPTTQQTTIPTESTPPPTTTAGVPVITLIGMVTLILTGFGMRRRRV
ncbi:MAG TPA: hypothetical protein PLK36_09880 [Methanoregulaceae archaeon]|nr:hypothetical protein [Methanoregulaceae archaeon]HQN90369.1 hypothetical protein [Methanoregulaceae archaeon]